LSKRHNAVVGVQRRRCCAPKSIRYAHWQEKRQKRSADRVGYEEVSQEGR